MATPRINIDVTADDQVDADLVARHITSSLTQAGFEDVTNMSHTHVDRDDEVVAAMRNLSPGIFTSEVVVETSTFAESPVMAGEGDDDIPGPGIPDADTDGDDDNDSDLE
jgi:hypothetical protein